MKRRNLLVGSVATAIGAAAAPWWMRSVAAMPRWPLRRRRVQRTDRPNVLMVSIDDLKPWIGPHGFTAAHTPALDELARCGVVFRRAYCAAPACSPSRAAVWTGLAPHQSGVYLNRHNWRDIIPHKTTFARLLRESGYFTAGFGKLFHGISHDDRAAWHERHHHKLMKMPGAPLNGLDGIWRKSGSRFDWAALDIPVEEMDDHKQVDRAIATMNRSHDRPWFVACGIFRPHLPWYLPKRFFDHYPLDAVPLPAMPADDLDDVPARGRKLASRGGEHRIIVSRDLWRPAVQAYMASITYADYELGRLLAETPPDTFIVLWSDHGWHLGPKNHWHKYTLWEEAAQTVFAVAGPGVATGKPCDRTVSLNDIYPTIAALCGLAPPHPLAGRSVLPLTSDPSAAWNRPALTTYGPDNHAIRSERYRYIRYDDGSEELYDHDADPHEWTNLAGTPAAAPIMRAHAALLPPRAARKQGPRKRRKQPAWLELPNGRRALVPT